MKDFQKTHVRQHGAKEVINKSTTLTYTDFFDRHFVLLHPPSALLSAGNSEIPLDQIYYLESDLRQINVYGDIPHQPICTFYGKMADLPAMLYENGFLQVGRSDVVNLQYVRSIRNYKVELHSGVELSVSRQYYAAIRSARCCR